TSILVAFDALKIEEKKAINMAQLFLKTYSKVLNAGKANYIEPNTAKGIVYTFLAATAKRKKKDLLQKRTVKKNRTLALLLDDPKFFEIDNFLKRALCLHITNWIMYNNDGPYNYEVVDAVFRLAGTGSVGLKRYVFLLKSLKENDKYILVEMKQCVASSLQPYVKIKQPKWKSEADRVVSIKTRIQNRPPALLSSTIFNDEPYLIQEMEPNKDKINFKLIKNRYRDIYQVIDDMAMLTASSQLRSSGRQGSATTDELIAFSEKDNWQQELLNYAIKYKKQVKKDYAAFCSDYKNGVFKL
ncbi:MAG: DUF2252 family protein, partial [Sphingobacteriales bacterium]|nr:DUF2252 family protein [Sphingobacteriales bacterium]